MEFLFGGVRSFLDGLESEGRLTHLGRNLIRITLVAALVLSVAGIAVGVDGLLYLQAHDFAASELLLNVAADCITLSTICAACCSALIISALVEK